MLGVPFGTFVGQLLGWRASFWIVAALGVLSLGGVAALVPNRHDRPVGLGQEVRVLKEPQVWLALLMTVLGFGGVFVVFTYIAPILQSVSGYSPRAVALILVLFGAGLTIGNTLGGKLADRALMPSLIAILVALMAVMVVFRTSHHPVAAAVTVFVWGSPHSRRCRRFRRTWSKAASAPHLASTLNIGAFNVGNALGAWLGGVALEHGRSMRCPGWPSR